MNGSFINLVLNQQYLLCNLIMLLKMQFICIQFQTATNIKMLSEQQIYDQLHAIETRIFDKMGSLKQVALNQEKWPLEEIHIKKNNGQLAYPKYDKKSCYYQEFWKIYLLNEIIISKVKDFSNINKQMITYTTELEQLHEQWNKLWALKTKKKVRRTSDMIEKIFVCPFEKCGKNYGSDVSLNLHMKLKHNSGTKTERQMVAKQIILAEEKGQKIKVDINFPPGFLEKFRLQYTKELNSR